MGRSGGIAVLWRHANIFSVLNFSRNFIKLEVIHPERGNWRLTWYYGFADRTKRRKAWNMIRNLRDIVLEGYQFTWWKSLGSVRAVEERLDRAMITPEWHEVENSWLLEPDLDSVV